MLAWQQVDKDRCPGCGNPLTETVDPETRGTWQVDKYLCFGCHAKTAHQTEAGEFLVVTRKV
jgi:hypothetical protein